jgi:hypothetical protein
MPTQLGTEIAGALAGPQFHVPEKQNLQNQATAMHRL